MRQRVFIVFVVCIFPAFLSSQVADVKWVDAAFERIRADREMDSHRKANLADSAFQMSVALNDECRQVTALTLQATHLDNIGKPDSALTQLYNAQRLYSKACDSMILMSLYRNLTNIYLSLGELNRVDSMSRIALQQWNHGWRDKEPRLAILNNLAIAQASRGNVELATSTFKQAYREAVEANQDDYIGKALLNLGSIKGMTGDLDSAYFFLSEAAGHAKQGADVENYIGLLVNLANVDMNREKYQSAAHFLDSAYVLAETQKNAEMLAQVQQTRSQLYANTGDYEKAYDFQNDFIEFREQFLNAERVNAVNDMMARYESERKARQIQQLQLENLDTTLENERIRNGRNRMMYVGIVVLLIAVALGSRLRYVRKSRAAIQKEKEVSESLLLNILPSSVANELKQKGFAEARHFSAATILFSDFKGFTEITDKLSAAELVEEINVCFKAFDDIVTRFGIEKIKTLGDAYMAAGGISGDEKDAALRTVQAGLEMQQFIIARKQQRDALALPAFEMRIGIHTGPVVAGIVGIKKFQYDLWGDTVNIASRMETNGAAGRVNISESTYQIIQHTRGYHFTSRGLIAAKGKGELAMYFVDPA